MRKRIFSIVLSLCMVLALMPATVFADDNNATKLQNMLDNNSTVTLSGDYTIDTTLTVSKTVTLDLNGHVIKMAGSGRVITVGSSGNLTMTDSSPNSTHTDASLPSGGVITGGNADNGGGVYVTSGGTFTMNGGNIANCIARQGGGVYVENGGTFIMTGGSITGCKAQTTYANDTRGGGICNFGTTKLSGNAVIRDCQAVKFGYNYVGGGVYSLGTLLEISGNVLITECTANTESDVMYVKADVSSAYRISGGMFYGSVVLWDGENNGSVSGGEFHGTVRSATCIKGGIFNGTVANEQGTISGGTFNGTVTNRGTISGGMFYGGINNSGTINGNKVTFMKDGSIYAVEVVPNGSTATAPIEPTKEGDIFTGWYTDEDLANKYDFNNLVNDNTILYAGFGYTITYEFNQGTLTDGRQVNETINEGITINLPDLENCGSYKFIGWKIKGSDDVEIYPAGAKYVPTKDMTFVAVYDEIVSLTVPFTTTVKQGGNVAPGKTTFNLQVIGRDGDKLSSEEIEVTASVTTNGVGDYNEIMTITGPSQQINDLFKDGGIFVQQINAGDPNWKYDDTVWYLSPAPVAMASTDDEALESTICIYPTGFEESDDGSRFYYPESNTNPVEQMSFTNTYTKSVVDTSDPEDTTNGDSDNESKADVKDSVKTGDNTNLTLWLALMLFGVAGITGTALYTRRRSTCKREI